MPHNSRPTLLGAIFQATLRQRLPVIWLFSLIWALFAPGSRADETPATMLDWQSTNPLPGRFEHACTEMNGRLWVIGGYGRDDVWSSADGEHWQLATLNTGFGPREQFTCTGFNNRLWLIGGQVYNSDTGSTTIHSDVWCSTDGVTWGQVTASAPFGPRSGHVAMVYDGKLWVIGGESSSGYMNDVWWTADGVSWTQATDHTAFSNRIIHASVVYDGKMWIFGGIDYAKGYVADAWWSTNGLNWTMAGEDNYTPRIRAQSVIVFYNQMVMIGGINAEGYVRQISVSTDGRSWMPVAQLNRDFFGGTVAAFAGKVRLIGGVPTYPDPMQASVYSSSNLATWTAGPLDYQPRAVLTALDFKQRLWAIGGISAKDSAGGVWSTVDGRDWIPANANLPDRYFQASVVYNDHIWVIGGQDATGDPVADVWQSPDGTTWTQTTATAPFGPRKDLGAAAFDGKIWVLGGIDGDNNILSDVWTSTDGANWTQVTTDAFPSRRGFHMLVYDDKLWVIGGIDASGQVLNDARWTTDGLNWTVATNTAAFPPRCLFAGAVYDKKMWVLGGMSPSGPLGDAWWSTDGVTWQQAFSKQPYTPRWLHAATTFNNQLWVLGGEARDPAHPEMAPVYLSDVWVATMLPPKVEVEPASLDFGGQVTGTGPGAPLAVTIRNTGGLSLAFMGEGMALDGTDAVDFAFATPLDTSPLASGQSRTVQVVFNPVTDGTKTAELRITTNDPATPLATVALQGFSGQPQVNVLVDGTTAVPDGSGMVDFGVLSSGDAPVNRTFTVRNSGKMPLTATGLTVPTGFTITEPLAETIPPGGEDTFTLALSTTRHGPCGGTVCFATNDVARNPYDFTVTGTVNGPVAVVLDGDVPLTNSLNNIDFGGVLAGDTPSSHTFRVENRGENRLRIQELTVPTGFTLAKSPAAFLDPNQSDTFTVELATTTAGAYGGEVHLATNDPNASPFIFNITGLVTMPEMAILDRATTIPSSTGSVNLGQAIPTQPRLHRTFTVTNTGNGELRTSGLAVPAGYAVTAPLAATIAPGASGAFTVELTATTPGTYDGTVSITSNDSDESPYVFTISATLRPAGMHYYVNSQVTASGDGTSWAKAKKRIIEALATAQGGDEIWVATGEYPELLNIPSYVAVYGGFAGNETALVQRNPAAHETIVNPYIPNHTSGEILPAILFDGTAGSVLDGLTVISPVNSSVFIGALHLLDADATNRITNCTIRFAVTAIMTRRSSPVLDGCRITGNQAAIFCYDGSSPQITSCMIAGNYFGGIGCQNGSSPTITNCVISGNAGPAIGCGVNSAPVISNCTISDNRNTNIWRANAGGLECSSQSRPIVRNTIFKGNDQCAILQLDADSTPTLVNCLFYGSRLKDYMSGYLDGPTLIGQLPGASGNLTGDPKLLDEPGGRWTAEPIYNATTYRTTFTDSKAGLTTGALVGRWIKTDAMKWGFRMMVLANTATTIEVFGNPRDVYPDSLRTFKATGQAWQVANDRPGYGSAAIDQGTAEGAPATDITGRTRPVDIPGFGQDGAGTGYDIGAYEAPTEPVVTVSPLNLAFGAWRTDLGTTTPQTVTITNAGFGALTFTGVGLALTGADANQYKLANPGGTAALAPGDSRTVTVSFDPSTAGPKTAGLTVTTNDAAHPAITMALSGTGVVVPSLIWVDFAWKGTESGTQAEPYNTLAEGTAAATTGGTVRIKAGASPEKLRLTRAVRLESSGGTARVGR